jgi:integrase
MAKQGTGSRNGNGEGTIFRRKDGRWVAKVTLPGCKRRDFYGPTRQVVAQRLTDALRAIRDGVSIPSERITVADFAHRWIEAVSPNLRPRTVELYESILRVHVIPNIGAIRLARLSPADVQRLYSNVRGSARNAYLVVHSMLEKAVRWDMVPRNVADLVDAPPTPRREVAALTPVEARRFLDAISGHRLESLFTLAITTGARSGELLGLSWHQVDFNSSTISIRRSLQEINGRFTLTEPKTKRSHRTIAISKIAVESLRRHRVRQLEESLLLGQVWRNEWNLVFTSEIGTPVDRHHVLRRHYRPLLVKAGLPVTLRFHDLRHIAASLALGQGMPIPTVSEMLGHSDAATTLRVYAHAMPGVQRQVAQAMDAVLAG